MRVVFMGTSDFSTLALQALVHAGHEIAAVYSQPPRPAGRGKKTQTSPVHKLAESLSLPVRTPTNFRDRADVDALSALKADVCVVVAYGLILPAAVLAAPKFGCLNIHASLLPRWRGAAPIHRAIMARDKTTGISIMQMDAGLDTGPVLLQDKTDILGQDTTGSLQDRLSKMGASLIVKALSELKNLTPQPQPKTGVTYAAKISKAEAQVDWSLSADHVDAHIRGLSPFPGAWCRINGERIKLLLCELAKGSGAAGTVLDNRLTVACEHEAVRLLRLQRAGKSPMSADDFTRGFPLPRGVQLDP